MGLELRRAYVNDLAVLPDGTCVSVSDDGHVQGWKHAQQEFDVIHSSENKGPVTSVVALGKTLFATAGQGHVQLWTTADAEPVARLSNPHLPGISPDSLVSFEYNNASTGQGDHQFVCLAARLRITHTSNPHQFHLPPQNEAQRQRRAQAEAQERALQHTLQRASENIQVWVYDAKTVSTAGGIPRVQSYLLEAPTSRGSVASVSCLCHMYIGDAQYIVVGDAAGGLRLWKAECINGSSLEFIPSAFFQLRPSDADINCSIVCLEALSGGCLAVSTQPADTGEAVFFDGARQILTHTSQAVHIMNLSSLEQPSVQSTLLGHQDSVICMCGLPNGDLLTGGGKMDATTQLWSRKQVQGRTLNSLHDTAHQFLTNVGYVFALAVLPDAKEDSNFMAVAAARYNIVKIVI